MIWPTFSPDLAERGPKVSEAKLAVTAKFAACFVVASLFQSHYLPQEAIFGRPK